MCTRLWNKCIFTVGQRNWKAIDLNFFSLLTSKLPGLALFDLTFFGHNLNVTFSRQSSLIISPPSVHWASSDLWLPLSLFDSLSLKLQGVARLLVLSTEASPKAWNSREDTVLWWGGEAGEGEGGWNNRASVGYLQASFTALRTEKVLSNYPPNELTNSTRCAIPFFRFKHFLLIQIQTPTCALDQVTSSLWACYLICKIRENIK